jgi:hypothetical protein
VKAASTRARPRTFALAKPACVLIQPNTSSTRLRWPLACRVTGVAPRALVDERAADLAGLAHRAVDGDVRRHLARPQRADEVGNVVAPVGAERDAPPSVAMALHEVERRLALCRAGGPRRHRAYHQPVAVLHEDVAHAGETALASAALAVEAGVRVGGGGVGLVGALPAAKVPSPGSGRRRWTGASRRGPS